MIIEYLQTFAETVKAKTTQLTAGEPEDQLRGPFENFMSAAGGVLDCNVLCIGETPLPDRVGRPDYAVVVNDLLAGFVELKAPGVGANTKRFKGHNREQWKRFQSIPNLLYTDGDEWALYRSGEVVRKIARLSGGVATEGKDAVNAQDASAVERILRDFLSWQPIIPTDRKGKIDLKAFAGLLAPLCRMLRDDVTDALQNADSPLIQLAKDWRQLLFPDASDERFADAYAQTVTFALLLGRSEGAEPLTLENAETTLATQHSLLSRALQVLTDPGARVEMSASLDLLLRVIAVVPPTALNDPEDPWLYFYEDFLATYDPTLRKDYGVYYTPVEVVHAQVRLIDELLANRLSKPRGFAEADVVTLDPGVGTGTYLLGVIEHALGKVEKEQGPGAVPGQATKLAANLYGFEIMVGPFSVSELRVSRALRDRGAALPKEGTHIYLTDTLESPYTEPPQLPLFLRPIADQHARALKLKSEVPVIVCLGNPPYDRHEAASGDEETCKGGWVRWGDDGKGTGAILRDFIEPAIAAGHGGDVKNMYNLYVYFWRWALWKVFEHETSRGPGIVSFITASSYIDGDAFAGMREHIRRVCDEIWILDVGGEGRGARKDENIFATLTPVAIAIAVRTGETKKDEPAKAYYSYLYGTREGKLEALEAIDNFHSVRWKECPRDWQAPFRPAGKGKYFEQPLLIDLMPWQRSGVKAGRTWVISPEEALLRKRWRTLLQGEGESRKDLFKDSPTGRKVNQTATQLPPSEDRLKAIADLPSDSLPPNIIRFAFRSFDREFIFADSRLLDRPGPDLWRYHGSKQVYLTSLLTALLGNGPTLTACSLIPDSHHFSARGGKDVIPLYRTHDGSKSNILPGLLNLLRETLGYPVRPEDFLAYVYGVLAHPAFTARFADELETRELRVPITKDGPLFAKVRDVGARLVWLHTYGERFVPEGNRRREVPRGAAKCVKAVPGDPNGYPESFEYNEGTQTLHVGTGEFRPVALAVFEFEVSGLNVVHSWLNYRMKKGAGKKSSPLDYIRPERWTSQFTTELLELLWVLEGTVAGYPQQAELLEAVVAGPCFHAGELPPVPEEMRKAPAVRRSGTARLVD